MSKQVVTYPYNGILLSNKKEEDTDSHNNKDKAQNNYTGERSPTKISHTICLHLFRTLENINLCRVTEHWFTGEDRKW